MCIRDREETAEEELYWGSELCWEYSEHHQPYNHGVQADPINQHQHQRFQSIDQRQNQRFQLPIDHLNQQQQQQHHKEHQHQQPKQLNTSRQEETQEGGAHDGCPSSEEDAPTGGANDGGQNASAEGVRGCGRGKSPGDDGGYAQLQSFHDNADKEDA